jgi:hypothetical protein
MAAQRRRALSHPINAIIATPKRLPSEGNLKKQRKRALSSS